MSLREAFESLLDNDGPDWDRILEVWRRDLKPHDLAYVRGDGPSPAGRSGAAVNQRG